MPALPCPALPLPCSWVAGNADLNPMYKHSHNPVAASALAVVYVFVLAVVLMNLLIGILTNSLERWAGGLAGLAGWLGVCSVPWSWV